MLEILPIKLLTEEDSQIFGRINVTLGILARSGFDVTPGIVVTPPIIKLQTLLNYYNLGHKELYEQTLLLVKKEVEKIPIPEKLLQETDKTKHFLINGKIFNSVKEIWVELLNCWMEEMKYRLWNRGFSPDLTQALSPLVVGFAKKAEAFGEAYFDEINDDVVIVTKSGKLTPVQSKHIHDLVILANRKLLIPHVFSWVVDGGVKIATLNLYTPHDDQMVIKKQPHQIVTISNSDTKAKSVTKVFLDMSQGSILEKDLDGIYICAEQIFNPEDKTETLDSLLFKVIESAKTLPDQPVLLKLPDIPEHLAGVRGTFRLLHQNSLFDPMCEAVKFIREGKKLTNVHVVIPFVRHTFEMLEIKRVLAKKGISRSGSDMVWMEIAVVENIINIEEYIEIGFDGAILNLDELIGGIFGFDHRQENLGHLKKEIKSLSKFLIPALKILQKRKIPVLVYGSLALDISMLEFLVSENITGVIVPRFEAISMRDLLYKVEKKLVLTRSLVTRS